MDGLELLNQANRAGLSVSRDGDQLVIRGPKSAGAVAKLLLNSKQLVFEAIEKAKPPEQPSQIVMRCPPPRTNEPDPWPTEVTAAATAILALTVSDLPPAPFTYQPGHTVVNAAKFLRVLQHDAQLGMKSPRALYGALQQDLLALQAFINRKESLSHGRPAAA